MVRYWSGIKLVKPTISVVFTESFCTYNRFGLFYRKKLYLRILNSYFYLSFFFKLNVLFKKTRFGISGLYKKYFTNLNTISFVLPFYYSKRFESAYLFFLKYFKKLVFFVERFIFSLILLIKPLNLLTYLFFDLVESTGIRFFFLKNHIFSLSLKLQFKLFFSLNLFKLNLFNLNKVFFFKNMFYISDNFLLDRSRTFLNIANTLAPLRQVLVKIFLFSLRIYKILFIYCGFLFSVFFWVYL